MSREPSKVFLIRPVSSHASPSRSARVASPNASEPDDGSLSAYAPTVSRVSRGRYFALSASLPYRVSG